MGGEKPQKTAVPALKRVAKNYPVHDKYYSKNECL